LKPLLWLDTSAYSWLHLAPKNPSANVQATKIPTS
jgi:hypothetical protein